MNDEAHTESYVDDLEERLIEAEAKAAAYDRLMGGKGCVYCNGPESLAPIRELKSDLNGKIQHTSEDRPGGSGWLGKN